MRRSVDRAPPAAVPSDILILNRSVCFVCHVFWIWDSGLLNGWLFRRDVISGTLPSPVGSRTVWCKMVQLSEVSCFSFCFWASLDLDDCYIVGFFFSDGGGSASRPRHNSCHAGGWSTTPRAQSSESASTPQSQQLTQPLATPETKGKALIISFILNIKYQHVSPLTSRITAFDNMQSYVFDRYDTTKKKLVLHIRKTRTR